MNYGINFNNFRVIRPTKGKFSTSEMAITGTTMSFNINTAIELDYPERVVLLASDDGREVAVSPWSPDMNIGIESSFQFYDLSITPAPKRIVLRDKNMVKALRMARRWSGTERWKASGFYIRETGVIFFDLNHATPASKKSGQQNKVLTIADYPKVTDLVRQMRPMQIALPAASGQDCAKADYTVL